MKVVQNKFIFNQANLKTKVSAIFSPIVCLDQFCLVKKPQ